MCVKCLASTNESRLSLLLYHVSQPLQAFENCKFVKIACKIHLKSRIILMFSSLNKSVLCSIIFLSVTISFSPAQVSLYILSTEGSFQVLHSGMLTKHLSRSSLK